MGEPAEKEVRFTLPSAMAAALGQGDEALSREAREAFILACYHQGKVGARFAAEALGLDLWDFYDLLGRRGLAVLNYEDEDFERELESLRRKAADRR